MRMAVRPCQTVPPHQQVPSACTAAMTCVRDLGRAERHEHLVQHDVVEDLEAGGREPFGEPARLPAVALEEFREP